MGIHWGVYPWELYIVAVLVAEKMDKNTSNRENKIGYIQGVYLWELYMMAVLGG